MSWHDANKRVVLACYVAIILVLGSAAALVSGALAENEIVRLAAIIVCGAYILIGWFYAAADFEEAFRKFKRSGPDAEPDDEFTLGAPFRFLFALIIWPWAILIEELKNYR